MSERVRMFVAERDGAVAAGPDGPVPVQRGDVVLIYVSKSWDEATAKLRHIAEWRKRG